MDDWTQTTIAVHDHVKCAHEFIDLLRVLLFTIKETNSEDGFVFLVSYHVSVIDDVAHDDDVLAEGSLCRLVYHSLFVC